MDAALLERSAPCLSGYLEELSELHHWDGAAHARNDVACDSRHEPHRAWPTW